MSTERTDTITLMIRLPRGQKTLVTTVQLAADFVDLMRRFLPEHYRVSFRVDMDSPH